MEGLNGLISLIGKEKITSDNEVSEEYKNNDALKTIRQFFREKKFTAKDTGVSYRVINNWKDKKILPIENEDQEWAKFNLTELLWIKIVNELRNFGLSLEKIRKIKEQILQWDKKHQAYINFEYKIYISIHKEVDLFLMIDPVGDADIKSVEFLIFIKNFLNKIKIGMPSLILISLKDLVKDYVYMIERPKEILTVSKSEIELLKKIRLSDAKKITVEKRNGKIFEIQTSEIVSSNPKISEKIKELRKEELYGDVVLKFQKGKAESMEIQKKKRFT